MMPRGDVDELIPSLRQYLVDKFGDEDLEVFCADYFRPVHDQFAQGMTKGQKVHLLLEYCRRHDLLSVLLEDLRKVRPEQVAQLFPQVAAQPVVPVQPPQVHLRNPRQVFISHAHEDAEFAHRLASDLQQRGWPVWIAPESIRPGERWVAAINRG